MRWRGGVNESEKSLNHHPSISPQARGLNVQELYDSEQCGKDFSDHSCLRTHRSTQNGGNPYEDNQDGKNFLTLYNKSFTGEKCSMFNQCRKTVMLSPNIVPWKSYVQEKALECRDVGRAFVNQSYLWTQVRAHNKEKLYKWKECGKTSGHLTSLHGHGPTHTVNKCYRCEDSGKVSTASLSHRQHIKTHTGEKPFQCDTCGKAFRFSSYLLVHSRIHTGI